MAGVDSLFDLAEGVLDGFDRILGPENSPNRRPDAKATASRHDPRPSRETSIAVAKRRFRVVEAINEDGADVWVVTDGRDRAECSSAAFAARVRDALG